MTPEILKQYSGRPYHNWQHILDMIFQYLAVVDKLKEPQLVLWAIIFHDIVYDAKATDNEEQSARIAERYLLSEGNLSLAQIRRVGDLILATKKHDCDPNDTDMCYLLDFDLRGLGLSWDIFSRNYDNIRKEYNHLSDEDFRIGRMGFLEAYSQKILFKTPEYQKFNTPAQENMLRQIDILKKS